METVNASSIVNVTGSRRTGLFSRSPYNEVDIVFILMGGVALSIVTITGNVLIMLSIKVNKNLKTVGNYFLFSLACTDLFTGVFSINIYAIYISIGYWPGDTLGCDIWLTVDYAVGHASVLHLLLISFDRYFCITKPMTYPAHRSTTMAVMLITAAWTLSFLIWTPLILFWDFFEERKPVPPNYCYCQFIFNPWATFVTSILFFFLPLCVMAYLYWRIVKTSYDSSRRNSRRPSSGSLSDIVYLPNITTKQEEEEEEDEEEEEEEEDAAAEEKEMLQQHSVVFRELQVDQTDTSSKTVSASTSKGSNTLKNSSTVSCRNTNIQIIDKWRKRYSTSREKKVTRTIMAVMIAFIISWTPYHVVVILFTLCNACVPDTVWGATYWLCYFNSTVNPACYALCNDTFKITFKQLLLCQYKNIRGQSLHA
ncbi:muscarinic acetylcholine receptor M2-like [Poecilia reticulata]|uniref:Muscarinic acetylcholine receptor n=1 Tax=Poecilia reticulata TaxID=8081 RepID=A0A3P9PU41_POERE|nr:PREDICTED: muscarinic acetylcholine receptor M2-like [Poecilia reticulata]XP_008409648.1 PREDICTED: muscarinic acetylcholine receptor M2-like [Poecilia reticulata]